MKKKILYTALFALLLASCSEQNLLNNRLPLQGGRKFSFRLMSLPVNC